MADDWHEFFEDFPDQDPANWVDGEYRPPSPFSMWDWVEDREMEREEVALREVIVHCDMLLHVMAFEYSPTLIAVGAQSRIPVLVNQFTFMHLFTTLFAVDGEKRVMGGACHAILSKVGRAELLSEISETLTLPVGDTTYADYIRVCRNRLAVHGDLAFGSLPASVQAVTFDDGALEQFELAGERFHEALKHLRSVVADELSRLERTLGD